MKTKLIQLTFFLIILLAVFLSYVYVSTDVSYLAYKYPAPFSKSDSGKITYHFVKDKPVDWIDLEKVSKEGKMAIVLSEDWAFFEHDGLDLNQLWHVFKDAVLSFRLTRGGSTITQQVVKNLVLSPEKSIIRKIKEMVIAKKIEVTLNKPRILELYLNLIEVGEELYGIEGAAEYYFNKTAANLDAREGAFIAMLLPNPKKYSISYKQKYLTEFAKNKIDNTLWKMEIAHILSESEYEYYRDEVKFDWEREAPPESFEEVAEQDTSKEIEVVDVDGTRPMEEVSEEDGKQLDAVIDRPALIESEEAWDSEI